MQSGWPATLAPSSASCPGPCPRAHRGRVPPPPSPSAPPSPALSRASPSPHSPCFSLPLTHFTRCLSRSLHPSLGHTTMESAHRYHGIGPPSFLPARPHAMLGINMVPGDAQPVLRPPSCPAAPFLGHTAGEQVRGTGTSRMRHREIKLNAAPVLRKEAVNRV